MKKHEINFLTNSGYCSDPTAMAILRRDEIVGTSEVTVLQGVRLWRNPLLI